VEAGEELLFGRGCADGGTTTLGMEGDGSAALADDLMVVLERVVLVIGRRLRFCPA
jgi:hypothetical protein